LVIQLGPGGTIAQDRKGKKMDKFVFNEVAVRTTMRNGEPWFVACDVCKILGLKNPTDACANLDEDEKHTLDLTKSALDSIKGIEKTGPAQQLGIVSESGLYALIFRSRKPVAKKFRRWVTGEVLPAIRKSGGYSVDGKSVLGPGSGLCAELMERLEREVRLRAVRKLWKAKEVLAKVCKETGMEVDDLREAERAGAGADLVPSARLLGLIREEVMRGLFRPGGAEGKEG
jgi:prophage antirepressor-like protein